MFSKRQTRLISLTISAIFLLILCLTAGCGSPYKAIDLNPIKLFAEKSRNAVNSSDPSVDTRQYLRLAFQDKAYQKDSQQVIQALQLQLQENPSPECRKVLAELLLLEARKTKKSESRQAVMLYLLAAQHAYDYLFYDASASAASSPLDPSYRFMADVYNFSIAKIIEMRGIQNILAPRDIENGNIKYHYEVVSEGRDVWDMRRFDYLESAYDVRVSGLTNQYVTKGIGAAMVGIVEKPFEKESFGRFYPRRLAAYPVSAALLFGPLQKTEAGLSRTIELVLYDSLRTESIKIANQDVPLEADFTTPLGLMIKNIKPFQMGLHNLLHSDVEIQKAGISMLEPYRSDKIPVVLVHGLMSSPATWVTMFNDLRGDPELREHYQFWIFMYPTGLPILYSASILRNQLNEIQELYDPNHTSPCFNNMVLVGHSMGGLLSRLMVQDSGTAYTDYYFKKPIDQIDMKPDERELVESLMLFDHLSYIKRVIFVSTPHRGSPLADAWYTHFFSGFIDLPQRVSNTASQLLERQGVVSDNVAKQTQKVNSSIILLSPSSPFMQVNQQVPWRSDIPYHSIIGTRISTESGPGTSDGVVPYASSHLDFAQSEKLVPSKHNAQTHPLAIAEVKRILKLHLQSTRQAASEKQMSGVYEN